MVAVGVVARRAERSAARVSSKLDSQKFSVGHVAARPVNQPLRILSSPFVLKVREKYPTDLVPNSIGLIGLP